MVNVRDGDRKGKNRKCPLDELFRKELSEVSSQKPGQKKMENTCTYFNPFIDANNFKIQIQQPFRLLKRSK